MDLSSTDDVASNVDTDADADVTAFDTDLPAAHNVSAIQCIFSYRHA